MRRVIVVFVLVSLSIGLASEDAKTALDWAFAKRAADGSAVAINFNQRVGIVKGDLFKIYISPLSGAYAYLFLHDEGGDLQLLFPDDFSLFKNPSYLGARYFVPEGDHWFALDDAPGTERFYLIASAERLSRWNRWSHPMQARHQTKKALPGKRCSTRSRASAGNTANWQSWPKSR